MKAIGVFLCAICALLLLIVRVPSRNSAAAEKRVARSTQLEPQPTTKARRAAVGEAYGRLPLDFEANEGQTDSRVKFLARSGSDTFMLTSTDAYWRRATARGAGVTLRMKLQGSNPAALARGKDELPGRSNYFKGNDPKKWHTHVRHYAKVEYQDIYPGVNLVYHGTQRQLEYDFVVSPGADPQRIALQFEGADRMEIDAHGDLVLHTAAGELRQKRPVIYQEAGTTRREIAGGYALDRNRGVHFDLDSYDPRLPLVIDPIVSTNLVYSTFLGGSGSDDGEGIAVDSSGNAYVTGATASVDFPTPGGYSHTLGNPPIGPNGPEEDAFVAKLNPAGTMLIYATYLGGNDNDQGNAIVVDSSGNAYVAGNTVSSNFPTTPGAHQTMIGLNDAGEPVQSGFVAKLNPSGSSLAYSTFLYKKVSVTSYPTHLIGLGVLAGNAYVAGNTDQIIGGSDPNDLNPNDCYVAELNASGSSLMYFFPFGGKDDDEVESLFVDPSGNAYVVGETKSTDFPTTPGAYQTTYGGGQTDGYLLKLNPTGSALVLSTFLGGSGDDTAEDLVVDAMGNVYVTGDTTGHFPVTPGAYRTTPPGGGDFYILKLNPAGSTLVYSTYLGGSGNDHADAIALDASDNVYVVGDTVSSDFPTTPEAFQKTYGGATPPDSGTSSAGDGFILKLNSTATALLFSTYLGGSAPEEADALALDSAGNVYVTGFTRSPNFPATNGALQARCGTDGTCNGNTSDAYITKIDTITGIPAAITGVSGNNQSGAPGALLPKPLVVQVADARGAIVAGATVMLSATNATINPASAITDPTGKASVQVTLGTASGPANVTATASGASAVFSFTVSGNVGPVVNAVVNGASFAPGGVVPGEIATIFGSNLTAATGINLTSSLPLPNLFLNNSVLVDGSPVSLFAVDNVNGQQQINFQVPFGVAGKSSVMIAVLNNGVTGTALSVPALTAQPGVFNYNVGGKIFGAILHANFVLADTAHPAVAGETVLIYCTGLGAVTSPPADGAAGSGQTTNATPNVTIGGKKATVSFSGLAPGFVGLYQINAVVPAGLASGDQPVVITMEGSSSSSSNSTLLPVK